MNIQYPSENSQKKQRILIISVSIVIISLGAIWFFSFKNTVQEMFKDEQPNESGLIDTIKTDFDSIIDELQTSEEEITTSTEAIEIDEVIVEEVATTTENIDILIDETDTTSTEKIPITTSTDILNQQEHIILDDIPTSTLKIM
jgi:hypothetical protein